MTLRRDLERRIEERLTQWCIDSANLYDMAGLSMVEATQDIFTTLLGEVIHLTLGLDLPIEKVTESIAEVHNKIKARRAEDKDHD